MRLGPLGLSQVLSLLLALPALTQTSDNPPFPLPAGDFRVIDIHVPQTPLRVDAAFRVVNGEVADGNGANTAIHMELVPRNALRAMQRRMPHQALAATPDGSTGSFRHTIEEPGDYRIVITNRANSTLAMVSLTLSTDLNADVVVTELTPKRRIAVIGVSFLLFFAMVGYSGWKLRKSAMD